MILPGDKNYGILRYHDRHFTFSSPEAAIEFSRNPSKYVDGVLSLAKESYDLVQLLHLYSYFPTVEALEKAKSYSRQRLLGQKPLTTEISTQVDTHIVDSYIDPKYKWNEWELRRQALMYVNLKNKLTHAAQTNMSHFKRESETQHYPNKDQSTQTKKNSSSMVPKTVHYLHGIRNEGTVLNPPDSVFKVFTKEKKPLKFKVLDLTIDESGYFFNQKSE